MGGLATSLRPSSFTRIREGLVISVHDIATAHSAEACLLGRAETASLVVHPARFQCAHQIERHFQGSFPGVLKKKALGPTPTLPDPEIHTPARLKTSLVSSLQF